MNPISVCWFRRDLRLDDQAALYHALKSGYQVLPVFIFDTDILSRLDTVYDPRVQFIHQTIVQIHEQLKQYGSGLAVYYGKPIELFRELFATYPVKAVYTNNDYEPSALQRDAQVAALCRENGADFRSFKDQVLLEKAEVLKDDGKPYTVFTPYSKKWRATLTDFHLKSYPSESYLNALIRDFAFNELPTLESMGFRRDTLNFPEPDFKPELIRKYQQQRDLPGIQGTSRLGLHLRFGTISIRKLATFSRHLSDTFLNELIWRDFYQYILWHFPHVGLAKAFKPEYDQIQWLNDESAFQRWCEGQTGYPIVDAGMRELNTTGFMHNRVRMITASFLSKHLLIDWRWGEAYFASKLLDFDLAANNGGWQWAAGSGCDAAPYFRIFNPYLQTQKFDPQQNYIRRWVPEINEFHYPTPIIQHEIARKRCLDTYAAALKKESLLPSK